MEKSVAYKVKRLGSSLILYGLVFYTYKVYSIDFMNLNLEKYKYKKVQYVFKIHPPSQGLFLHPVKEGVQGFYFFVLIFCLFFFRKTTKNAF